MKSAPRAIRHSLWYAILWIASLCWYALLAINTSPSGQKTVRLICVGIGAIGFSIDWLLYLRQSLRDRSAK
jgi:hypothetical protein